MSRTAAVHYRLKTFYLSKPSSANAHAYPMIEVGVADFTDFNVYQLLAHKPINQVCF